MTAVARTVRAIPEDLRRLQVEASDPAVSAWVTANAGSGKTHVLAQRVGNRARRARRAGRNAHSGAPASSSLPTDHSMTRARWS